MNVLNSLLATLCRPGKQAGPKLWNARMNTTSVSQPNPTHMKNDFFPMKENYFGNQKKTSVKTCDPVIYN